MMHSWRWLRALVALSLILTLCGPMGIARTAEAETVSGTVYGVTTLNTVNVRKQPSASANYWFRVDSGFVCEVLDTVTRSGETWYKVRSAHPKPNGRTYIGYIKSTSFRLLTAQESANVQLGYNVIVPSATATQTPGSTWSGTGATATPAPSYTEDGYISAVGARGEITASGTNFRVSPSLDGGLIGKLNAGTVVDLVLIPTKVDNEHWYRIRYNGQEGYVLSTFVRVISSGATTVPATSTYGYATLLYDSANLRDAAAGTTVAIWQGKGTTLEIAGPSQDKNGYTWYPVYYGVDKKVRYVRFDVVSVEAGSGVVSTATPAPGASSYGYVITTEPGVNLRLTPSGEIVTQVPKNVVVTCVGAAVTPVGSSYSWYFVSYQGMMGYLRGDCVKVCDASGNPIGSGSNPGTATATPAPGATQVPSVTTGYVKLVKGGVNLRVSPAGESQGQYDKGLILPIVGTSILSGKYTWYYVRTPDGKLGYMRSDCVTLTDVSGVETPATPTPAPGATNAPSVSAYGYIQITKPSTNVRDAVGGETFTQVRNGTVWPMNGRPTTYRNQTWFPIVVNGTQGYVVDECAYQLSQSQVDSYLSGNGVPVEPPAPTPALSSYVQTTLDYVNLRETASRDARSVAKVRTGTVMLFTTVKQVGTASWYRVNYKNETVWVLGSCVKVMTQAEYNAYMQNNPSATPTPTVSAGYVKTTEASVNVRNAAGGSSIVARLNKGTIVPYYGTRQANGYSWYQIRTANGVEGYIRADMAITCDASGNPVTAPTTPPSDGSKPEAVYTTLRLGSSGTAVKNLVEALKAKGYYTGAVTSSYTSAVQTAVKAFQAANNLTVDGIAGKLTQHALYGTVDPGQDFSNVDFTFYPAEKIDWYTGGIQQLWARGASYKVYDVKTGIVWWARRWAGSAHCDVEPLTAEDTARLCQIYGVKDAQEIWDNNLWQRRPCLVTIGTRTFACSLFGMPHNPDGDTIPDNNMTGQICIHFTNSKGHDSGRVDSYHQEAIQYAYEHSPMGQK